MRFMPLTAETLRVRNAAKAHAAGEMSQSEYRRIRREAIASFLCADHRDGDDTQRRWQYVKVAAEPKPDPLFNWWRLLAFKTAIIALLAWWLI